MISSRQREWGIGVACRLRMVHGGTILQAQEPTPVPVRVPVIAVQTVASRDVRYATVAGVEPRFHSLA